MTSVLAGQLQELARQRQPTLPAALKKGKPSLLFDFKKAADIDLQTIHDIACQGLDELIRLEPRFRPYRESLFSRASLDINPELQTAEFQSKADESIFGFNCLLCNHFLSPAAFKVLEYLIRRYKANERNVNALMIAALPYHSTNEFVRLVQTLAVGAPGSLWGWLSKMQSSGAALPRDLLAQRCANDRRLLVFVCKAAGQLGTTSKSSVSLKTHSPIFLSFYAVLLCEVLSVLPSIGEDVLTDLLPHMLDGLSRAAVQDYRAATSMAVAELSSRATLGRDFVKVLLNTLLKCIEPVPEHVRTALLLMAHLAVTQPHIKTLSDKTLKYLSSLPNVISELTALSQRGNIRVGPLLHLLCRSLVAALVGSGGSEGGSTARRSLSDLLGLAHSGALRGEPAKALAASLLEAGGSPIAGAEAHDSCRQVLRVLDQRYPETTDSAVNAFLAPLRHRSKSADPAYASASQPKRRKADMTAATSDDEDDKDTALESADAVAASLSPEDLVRFNFVRSTFVSGGYSTPCGGTMMTLAFALTAPQAAVRRMALQQLDADLTAAAVAPTHESGSADASSEAQCALRTAALERLRDDDLTVVVAALGLSCIRELPPKALLDALQPLVHSLGDFLYGSVKLPQLMAARKASRKVISLLRHAGAGSDELREAAALQLLAFMLPSTRDPRIALDAASAAAKLGLPLFSGLSAVVPVLEANVKAADGESGKKRSEKEEASKLVTRKSVSSVVERGLLAGLAKTLASDAEARFQEVTRLLMASVTAASSVSDAASAASMRAQHMLLLAAHAAATGTSAVDIISGAVKLAELLLPYANVSGCNIANWSSDFAEQVSKDDGLPTDDHLASLSANPFVSHASVIMGVLSSNLSRLSVATDDDMVSATRALRQLSLLDCPAELLQNLPVLLVTRNVCAASQCAFLSSIFSAPSTQDKDGAPSASLQALALRAQTALLSGSGQPLEIHNLLVALLPALGSSFPAVCMPARACMAALGTYIQSASASTGLKLSVGSLVAVCKAISQHGKLISTNSDAVRMLIRSTLFGSPARSEPSKKGGSASAKRTKDNGSPSLGLSDESSVELAAYLADSLNHLTLDAAGLNSAISVLNCVVPDNAAISPELFTAGASLLVRVVTSLRKAPSSATALHAHAVQKLLTLYVPATAAAATSDLLGAIPEAIELIPPSITPVVVASPAEVSALAAVRLAAVQHVTPDLFAALPAGGQTRRELFAVLLARYEGDPDELVRAAARVALETIPLDAELLVGPLRLPDAATYEVASPSNGSRAKKKSKVRKEEGVVAAVDSRLQQLSAVDLVKLRDAVAVLELLQWRSGISSPHLLVSACQLLLHRLLPVVGSIATVLDSEGKDAAEETEDANTKSSLAGYAATLALTALTALAQQGIAVDSTDQRAKAFGLELAVRAAREAPDASVRNAALGWLTVLAKIMPGEALSYALQILAVINQAAASQDDENSRAVGATTLAAVVPAWITAGRSAAALWEQVVSSLGSLPAYRRSDVLLSLLHALPKVEDGLSDGLFALLQHAANGTTPTTMEPNSGKPAADKGASHDAVQDTPPSVWLPELASQLAFQVDLPVRLACCARLMHLALAASGRQPQKALPRTAVAFVTAQLKMKVAVNAARASYRRPDPDESLEAACRQLMEAALSQMQLLQPDTAPAANGVSPSTSSRKAFLAASRALYDLFAALQGVMSADTYLQTLLILAEYPADKVKRRAIKLFTDKVRGVRSEIQDQIELPQRVRNAKLRQASEAAACACAMLRPLLAAGPDAGASSPLTRQLALVALSAIAAEFGVQQGEALLAGIGVVLAATKHPHASIRASALATVAAYAKALGQQLVPVLPLTVSSVVSAADAAWGRLQRAGAANPSPALPNGIVADMQTSDNTSEDEQLEDSDDEDGEAAATLGRRRRGPGADREDAALELSSALACLNALVETLGGFLSPHLPSVLAILLNPRVLTCRVAGCDQFAASIRTRLPTAIPPRLLLPALYDRLQPCIELAAESAGVADATAPTVALLHMVAAAASSLEPKVAVQYHEQVFVFLLRAMDVRQRRPAALVAHGDAALDVVEGSAIRALVALVMKLSEARFKPLFLRILEWASTISVPEDPVAGGEPSYMGRMVAFFGAVCALADRLRSVIVPYFKYILDACVQHLGVDESSKPRSKKKQKRASIAAIAVAENASAVARLEMQERLTWLLRVRIVRALHRCFLHDSVGFVDADRFSRLQPALVSQLDVDIPDAIVSYLTTAHQTDPDLASYISLGKTTRVYTAPDGEQSGGPLGAAVVSCLLAMAVAANSDALWKPLNHATLMLTRSSTVRTRALALEVVAQLVDRLREEYLVLLPEALPFFSELLEDTDAAVAGRVREVVAQLEEISGEKLDEYLKV